jgi:hypothetical protein
MQLRSMLIGLVFAAITIIGTGAEPVSGAVPGWPGAFSTGAPDWLRDCVVTGDIEA